MCLQYVFSTFLKQHECQVQPGWLFAT